MRERLAPWLMLAPALAVIVVLFLGALVLGLLQSLNYLPMIGRSTVSLDAYRLVLTNHEFGRSLLLTLQIAFACSEVSTVLGVACALVLRRAFPGVRAATFLFQLNLPVPHLVGAVGVMMLLSQSGFAARLGHLIGMVQTPGDFPALVFDPYGIGVMFEYVWKETVFIGVIALAILRSLGTDYEELAAGLGANGWQRFLYVLVPLMTPGLLSASVIVFAFVFGAFEVPLLLGATFPVPLSVLAYRYYSDVHLDARSEAMAVTMIMTLIVGALTYVYMRMTRHYIRE
jgi:putative spermidine/putrescine transport system permease protein